MSSAAAACANLAHIRFSGQTLAHFPQLRQFVIVASATSSWRNAKSAEEPFITGTSKLNIACPIIGPPEISFTTPSFNSPASFTNFAWLVPIGTTKLDGVLIPSPDTVTILSVNGLWNLTAL